MGSLGRSSSCPSAPAEGGGAGQGLSLGLDGLRGQVKAVHSEEPALISHTHVRVHVCVR